RFKIATIARVEEHQPGYIDSPYYLAPEGPVGQEAFAVIRDTIAKLNMVALGRVVLARREHVHLLSCDIEREPAGVAQLAAAGSSLDRHEIAARPATSASDPRPRKHPCRDRSSNANSLQGQNSAACPPLRDMCHAARSRGPFR